MPAAFVLTARQYGEVVLPDAASGHDPDTLATKLSRCKEGMAWFLQIQVQVLIEDTRVAVQVLSEPGNCQDIVILLTALEQRRGTSLIGARNLSRCWILFKGRCGCPGTSFGRICLGSRVLQKP